MKFCVLARLQKEGRRQKAEEETPIPLPLSCLPSLNSTFPCDSSALSSTGDSCFLSSSSETMIILINKQWGRSIYYANSWKGSQKTPGLFPVPLICRLKFPWVSQFPGFGEQLRGASISAMVTAHCYWFFLIRQGSPFKAEIMSYSYVSPISRTAPTIDSASCKFAE